jgi:hypothetical protein
MSGKSPARLVVERAIWPSTTAMSALVPPISKVSNRCSPASSPMYRAPITPDAGPESSVCTGAFPALAADITPPFDLVERTGAGTPIADTSPSSEAK